MCVCKRQDRKDRRHLAHDKRLVQWRQKRGETQPFIENTQRTQKATQSEKKRLQKLGDLTCPITSSRPCSSPFLPPACTRRRHQMGFGPAALRCLPLGLNSTWTRLSFCVERYRRGKKTAVCSFNQKFCFFPSSLSLFLFTAVTKKQF